MPFSEIEYGPQLREALKRLCGETRVVVLSCLAAQFAICEEAGEDIRAFSSQKLLGVFESQNRGSHPLLEGLGRTMLTPHSRWGDIPEDRLPDNVQVLSASEGAGVALAVSDNRIYIPAHMEYGPDNLAEEAARDGGPNPVYPKGADTAEHLWASDATTLFANVNSLI